MYNFIKIVDGEVRITKDELLEIPEALAILHKDKGGVFKGDYDGRRKYLSRKQFALAWWTVDSNSPAVLAGYNEEECLADGIKNLGFPANWKPESHFFDYLERYKVNYERFIINVLVKEILRSFKSSADSIAAIRKNTNRLLRTSTLNADEIKSLIAANKELIDFSTSIPKQITKLKDALEDARREEKNIKIARGGVVVSQSMIAED